MINKKLSKTESPPPRLEPSEMKQVFFEVYRDHSKNLRTWLLAYGVGGPAFILSQDHFTTAIINSGASASIVVAFLSGVGVQIVLSLLNKWCAWQTYDYSYGSKRNDFATRLADALNRRFWIDTVVDLITICSFGYATVHSLFLVFS